MKITNRSTLMVDESLWREIAQAFCIDGNIAHSRPQTDELKVVIRKPEMPSVSERALFGWHSPFEIVIKPCRHCTSGTVFLTYLHELLHQWLYQYQPEVYDEDWSEFFCEGAARAIFSTFGGSALNQKNCTRWFLPEMQFDVGNNSGFQSIVAEIRQSSPRNLRELGRNLTSSFSEPWEQRVDDQ